MKRLFLAVMLLGLFCLWGCGKTEQTAVETVGDDLSLQTSLGEEMLYDISIYVPSDVTQQTSDPASNVQVYAHESGEYEIYTQRLIAPSEESAIRQLTGRQKDELTVIRTQRFNLPEYRFAWFDDKSGQSCRADMVQDGDVFYAVVFAVDQACSMDYRPVMAEVFSTFGLNSDEGV